MAALREPNKSRRVAVLLPLPLAGAYDYAAGEGQDLRPGDVVCVPLGSRQILGVVWEKASDSRSIESSRLKRVVAQVSEQSLPEALRRFIDWVSEYTLAPPGAVLRMVLRSPEAFAPVKPLIAYQTAAAIPATLRRTPTRQRVLEVLSGGPPRSLPDLAQEAGVTPGVIKGLEKAGAIETVELPSPPAFARPDGGRPGPWLSPAQSAAAEFLATAVSDQTFTVTLLDGVTGAGKTEVYLEAVAAALRSGRQVLVLLPEIALTAQWLARFEERFGTRPAEWHSDLTSAQRRRVWRAVLAGEARVVVGARSALFLPFAELGLIVVDEEHDSAFKQEDGVIYHARDMAVVRAKLSNIPIVLASATPSLETMVNVEQGRYRRVALPDRHGGAQLPEVRLVDLRKMSSGKPGTGGRWISPALDQAIVDVFAQGRQVMLFLNRRGYAPLTLCRACGHRLQCPDCTAWLVEHRLIGRLQCHHCGFAVALPDRCPQCETEDSLVACGPGVERLAEEVAARYPEQTSAVFSSDTVHSPSAAAQLVEAMQNREVDLLIGTQVIAKGHHFPDLTLVGVIDADLGLLGGDLRAAERSFQLLHQVAGRAGRAVHPGRVLIQTYEPEHPVMVALAGGGRDAFLAAEAQARQQAGMPPYARLAALVVSSRDRVRLQEVCRELARRAPRGEGIDVLGPAPAPLAVLRGRHRQRFLLRTARQLAPQRLLRAWIQDVKLPHSIRLQVDVDPYSFL